MGITKGSDLVDSVSLSSNRETRSGKVGSWNLLCQRGSGSARWPRFNCRRFTSLFAGLAIPPGEKDYVVRVIRTPCLSISTRQEWARILTIWVRS